MGNWKKYAEDEWALGDDKYSFAKVWKIGLSAHERKRRHIQAYAFSGRIGRDGIETKAYFKSKPRAMAFAKAWIKKHGN